MGFQTKEIRSLDSCRADFPSLGRQYQGRSLVYLDGPGGSQVPQSVIDAVSHYYQSSNSNSHGAFVTARETDEVIEYARKGMAALLGAAGPETISFGQNMTTLNFSLSKSLARFLELGSEILITQLDHEANRGPWLTLKEYGFRVKEVRLRPEGTLDYDDFRGKLTEKTSLVAVGYASNALGTVNNLKKIREWTRETGSLLLVDAVHHVPHFSVDVTSLDCDFLLCSAYKFYGPHVGILYCRPGLLDRLPTDQLATQDKSAPYKIETGTLNHAALAGVGAAVDYLATLGNGTSLREKLLTAMSRVTSHEFSLYERMYYKLLQLEGLTIIGPKPDPHWHTPTISFALEGYTPIEVCKHLASNGICTWDGHFYAQRAIEVLGLLERGGVTRLGINIYTNQQEVDYTIDCMHQLAGK